MDEVHVEGRAERLNIEPEREGAGVRHQYVYSSKLCCSAFNPVTECSCVPNIHRPAPRSFGSFGCECSDCVLHGVASAGADRNGGAFCRETLSDRASDATG